MGPGISSPLLSKILCNLIIFFGPFSLGSDFMIQYRPSPSPRPIILTRYLLSHTHDVLEYLHPSNPDQTRVNKEGVMCLSTCTDKLYCTASLTYSLLN